MEKTEQNILKPDHWVVNHGDYLYSYTISRMYSTQIAEDIIQDTFLSAFEARNKFRGNSTERTWLISILKRKIADYYRKHSKNPELSVSTFTTPFITQGASEGAWDKNRAPGEWDMNKIDGSDKEGFLKVFQHCLSLLPLRMAASFSLKNIEELSTEEICKDLSISPSNLWVLLHRARLQLRECIENKWF